MTQLRDALASLYPSIAQMPFCAALLQGRFDKDAVLRAEVVEIYRALLVRERVKRACESKIASAVAAGALSLAGARTMRTVVEDEGQTDDHIDHLDMRLKLFQSLGDTRNIKLVPNRQLDEINAAYVAVIEAADAFQVIGINAAMEDWYAPIAAFFEEQHLRRGFTIDEVETYTVHKAADVWHSSAGFRVLADHQAAFDVGHVADAVRRVFATSLAYDGMKLELAQGGDIRRLLALPQ